MTHVRQTRRLLLVTDRRTPSATLPAAGLRRYRLARVPSDRQVVDAPAARRSG